MTVQFVPETTEEVLARLKSEGADLDVVREHVFEETLLSLERLKKRTGFISTMLLIAWRQNSSKLWHEHVDPDGCWFASIVDTFLAQKKGFNSFPDEDLTAVLALIVEQYPYEQTAL